MEKQKKIEVENVTNEDVITLYGKNELKTRNDSRRNCKRNTTIWGIYTNEKWCYWITLCRRYINF